MQLGKSRCVVAVVTIAAVGAGAVAAISASAADSGTVRAGDTAKIKMEVKGKDLIFSGPKRIERGAKLEIVNKTLPDKVGPHTFTLIKANRMPTTKRQIRECEKVELAVCANIVKAHKADPQTGVVKKPDVDVGRKGWDKSFGRTGDSVFLDSLGAHSTRRVSANAGKTLYYFCAVHPFMQGKIKVVR